MKILQPLTQIMNIHNQAPQQIAFSRFLERRLKAIYVFF